MQGFRNKRIALLVLALVISGIFIAAPWKEPQPEGAPLGNTIRGPNWGIDITGGSRIMLRLETTQAPIEISRDSDVSIENRVANLINRFEENLESPVRSVGMDNRQGSSIVTVEIGRYVSENRIKSVLVDGERLDGEPRREVSQSTQDDVKEKLKLRVDPIGTLGAQFKPLGGRNQYLQFEVSLGLKEARELLGREGLPEVFVDGYRVIWSKHLRDVSRGTGRQGEWQVSFGLTDEGKRRFADYTGAMKGIPDKKGHPGVIYLDRPSNSVLLFRQSLEEDIQTQASQLGFEDAEYSEEDRRFRYQTPDRQETPIDEGHWFSLEVPAVKIQEDGISPSDENYISSLEDEGEINKAILLGDQSTLPVKDGNLVIENKPLLPLENISKLGSESEIELLNRAVGIESWPTLQPSITANIENLETGLRITTGTGEEAKDEAEKIRLVLSQRLPVEVNHISEEEISGRLSGEDIERAAIAGLIAFAVVAIMVFSFYRKFKVVFPLLLTMASEVIITLGAASAVPDGLMSIGLPGLGGLIAVVGTGVDHQIIITDEVLGEKFKDTGQLPLDRRTGRAFSVIFAAAATTIVAMIALATFGFGAMRGFAIVTLSGVLISVLITRPAYANIIGNLLKREREEKRN